MPDDILKLIRDMAADMELYERKQELHKELKFRVVMWWVRFRIRNDMRYARFLMLY